MSRVLKRYGKYKNIDKGPYSLYKSEHNETGCGFSFPRWVHAFV